MKWITEIIDINPYKITCKWNNNEIRTIDLTSFISDKGSNPESSYYQLKDKDRFLQVKCDGTTIYWENGRKMKDLDDSIKTGPLDIDPDVLYEMTIKELEKSTS